jgi:Rrf2 family transcriptional regulator, iron-sulfur cluster assembly transcription factor
MNLSKSSQYALRIVNYLILNDNQLNNAKILHEKLKIPYPYLRRVLTILSGKKILKGGKGRGGGYVLAKKPGSIFIIDILRIFGDSEIFNSCLFGFKNCLLSEKCVIHDEWSSAKDKIIYILNNTSLNRIKRNILKSKAK